jgi:hypothetical protein
MTLHDDSVCLRRTGTSNATGGTRSIGGSVTAAALDAQLLPYRPLPGAAGQSGSPRTSWGVLPTRVTLIWAIVMQPSLPHQDDTHMGNCYTAIPTKVTGRCAMYMTD